MSEDPAMPVRVLLVGAYERDNFGDLLYLLVTEHYLHAAGAVTVAGAPFAADMSELLEREVLAYGPLLRDEDFDQVWTVGGEVGSVTGQSAFRMSMPAGVYAAFRAAPPPVRRQLLRDAAGGVDLEAAYLPRLSAFPRNAAAVSVLNSVGLSGITRLDPARQVEFIDGVREAGAISVRDGRSAEMLQAWGVPHRMAPDLVHTIALHHRPADRGTNRPVVVQASDEHLSGVGHRAFAEALAAAPSIADSPIRLLVAGTAVGHDSVASYEEIIKFVRASQPGRDIAILTDRRPWDLVDAIAGSRLWIGTSLHGRIVASAYSVPRVSLAKRKVNEYARTWDPDMPFNVSVEGMAEGAEVALSPEAASTTEGLGRHLAELAQRNVEEVIAQATALPPRRAAARRVQVLEDRRQREGSELRAALKESEVQLSQARALLKAYRSRGATTLTGQVAANVGEVRRRLRRRPPTAPGA